MDGLLLDGLGILLGLLIFVALFGIVAAALAVPEKL